MSDNKSQPLITLEGVTKVFLTEEVETHALSDIRLEIQNRAPEIEITKLVGGTDAFIRRPFLYLGVCYGLAGAALACLLIFATLAALGAPVRDLAALYETRFALTGLSLRESGALLGGGALLGWAGALLATARHLRAVEPR